MNRRELKELGEELLDDLEDAFSDFDFIDVDYNGIEDSGCGAVYSIEIEWDYDDMVEAGVSENEIEEALDDALSDWGDNVAYDWQGSCITVGLSDDDY